MKPKNICWLKHHQHHQEMNFHQITTSPSTRIHAHTHTLNTVLSLEFILKSHRMLTGLTVCEIIFIIINNNQFRPDHMSG